MLLSHFVAFVRLIETEVVTTHSATHLHLHNHELLSLSRFVGLQLLSPMLHGMEPPIRHLRHPNDIMLTGNQNADLHPEEGHKFEYMTGKERKIKIFPRKR